MSVVERELDESDEAFAERLRRNAAYDAEVSGLSGMTVNERLFERRLTAQWNAAKAEKDSEKMLLILRQIEVEDAEWVADHVLKSEE